MLRHLTHEELALCRALWDGDNQKEASVRLDLPHTTVHHLIRSAKRKLGAASTIALLRRCVQEGLLTP